MHPISDADARALDRYRYLLRTAPADDIERAHAEAFARLTPEQRRAVLDALAGHVPASELRGDGPDELARTATRAEIRQPGVLENAWRGPGLGEMFLASFAGAVIGTVIAHEFFAADAAAFDADAGTEGDAAAGGDNATFGGDDAWEPDAGAGDPGDFGDVTDLDFGGF